MHACTLACIYTERERERERERKRERENLHELIESKDILFVEFNRSRSALDYICNRLDYICIRLDRLHSIA
jgi:hypothetical protein